MKKQIIIGIAMAMGVLSVSALSASAADSCGKCADAQAVQQFTQETASLTSLLKAKDIELREQFAYDSIDTRKVSALEEEIKELKNEIDAAAKKYGIPACSRG
jgi:peptidoglycan hydrolase CwlO-like protein